jgi:hypothetical protein
VFVVQRHDFADSLALSIAFFQLCCPLELCLLPTLRDVGDGAHLPSTLIVLIGYDAVAVGSGSICHDDHWLGLVNDQRQSPLTTAERAT